MNWWISMYWLGDVLMIRLIWVIVWISLYLNQIQIYWNFCCLLFSFFPMLWQIGKFFLASTAIIFNRCFSWKEYGYNTFCYCRQFIFYSTSAKAINGFDITCINILPFTWVQENIIGKVVLFHLVKFFIESFTVIYFAQSIDDNMG